MVTRTKLVRNHTRLSRRRTSRGDCRALDRVCHQMAKKGCGISTRGRTAMTLASTDADSNFVVRLEEELCRLEQLRECVLESLAARLQGPRQRYYLRVQLLELNRSITGIRGVLSLPALASPPRFRRERQASTRSSSHPLSRNHCTPATSVTFLAK